MRERERERERGEQRAKKREREREFIIVYYRLLSFTSSVFFGIVGILVSAALHFHSVFAFSFFLQFLPFQRGFSGWFSRVFPLGTR